jgi:hypothetical protein
MLHRYMDTWTEGEMRALRDLCYPRLSDQDLAELLSRWVGGMPAQEVTSTIPWDVFHALRASSSMWFSSISSTYVTPLPDVGRTVACVAAVLRYGGVPLWVLVYTRVTEQELWYEPLAQALSRNLMADTSHMVVHMRASPDHRSVYYTLASHWVAEQVAHCIVECSRW